MLLPLKCLICLEEYANNDKSEKAPKILSCGHTFCCKCIKEILKKIIIKLFVVLIRKRKIEHMKKFLLIE